MPFASGPPNIYFYGDVHGNFEHVLATVQRDKPDAVIFLGDLEAQWPLDVALEPIIGTTQIHWVHGNHDTDSTGNYTNVFDSTLGPQNLHGRVVDVCGLKIAGLGGVFRGKVWMPPDEPFFDSYAAYAQHLRSLQPPHQQITNSGQLSRRELTHKSTIFPDIFDGLATLRADILVTHEAPSCHPKGFKEIDSLARALGVTKTFHGHHHDRLEYSGHSAALGFKAFGVGFCGITDLEGNVISPGYFD